MSPRTVRTPGRRAAGRRRGRGSTLLIGGIAIVILAIASLIGYRAAETVPGRKYYNLKAEFTAADNLSNHYEVRIGGLRAGQILKPRVKDGKALVDIRLDEKFKPLKSDTKMQVRLRSAVGVRYLELIPGTKGTDLPEGGLLATSNQTQNVALDQVLGTLDPATREKAQSFLNELGTGAADNGANINLALKKLSPFLKDVQTLAEPIIARPGITRSFVRNTSGAVDAFAGVRQVLAQTFDPAQRALKPFADNADAIGSTLDEATPTLNQLQNQLPQVDRLVAAADGLAKDGRPALQAAPSALRQTTSLMKGARPALRQAKVTLDLAKATVDPTVNVLQTLQTQLPRIDTTLGHVNPILTDVGDHACDITNALGGWASFLTYGTNRNNFIRFFISLNLPNELGGATKSRLVGPDGKPLLDNQMHLNPYPAGCINGEGEGGGTLPTVAEAAKDLTYSQAFPVIR
ncbi:MlaD family protein [Patulibacter sp. NPDC049589]|uniref:MlaD family protein n=1 Tax=Patulibacter sp. NPDC049589 TaxID=3154731 RepID=UPI0034462B66